MTRMNVTLVVLLALTSAIGVVMASLHVPHGNPAAGAFELMALAAWVL